MVQKQHKNRSNRYKKSGKGGFVLAALIITVCLLIIGGYWFYRLQQSTGVPESHQQPVQKPAVVVVPPPQAVYSSPTAHQTTAPRNVVEAVPPLKQDYYNGDIPFPRSPRPTTPGKAELAILVDDMGSSLQEARSLATIGVPINFAIIPGLRQFKEVAGFAAGQGIEVLVHMPMQPKEYPKRRLESNGLLLEQSDDELRSRVREYLASLPNAIGANNHMGSGFTENPEKMRVVLSALKEKGLFYLDSITTPHTVGPKIAAELQMRRGRRDVFLDNEQNEGYIRGQLAQAVTRALKNGRAIAICHPHPMTIATLGKVLPELRSKGITLVPISKLIN